MPDIYRQFEEVLVWLGEAEERDTLYLWMLSTLLKWPTAYKLGPANWEVPKIEAIPLLVDNDMRLSWACCSEKPPIHGSCWDDALCDTGRLLG